MNKRFTTLILGTLTSLSLLFGNPLGAFMSMASMHDMMPHNQCQSSCGTQTPVGIQGVRQNIKDEEAEPQPAEPYYLSIVVFISLATAVAIILKLYRSNWRPPDRLAQLCLLRI